jgi:SAM-dependent methyltransferase
VSAAPQEVDCVRPSEGDAPSKADRRLVAVTIDYETWQPIPDGKVIDWEADVFQPADRLMQTFERHGAPITFFAEMGEYIWLEQNRPEIAAEMARQLEDAIRRGHDVQLHLHPNWLPELGARCENDGWYWDFSFRKLHDYPGDLAALIGRCKGVLESITRRAKPDHAITCFRAGGYSAQPFRRIYDALSENGIFCDSSVYAGGADSERGYDYTLAYSEHQPYFANRFDPQLKAPPAELSIIELPIFAYRRGRRWCLDGTGTQELAGQFLEYQRRFGAAPWPDFIKRVGNLLYGWSRMGTSRINRLIPRALTNRLTDYRPETLVEAQYYVMIGHTKTSIDFGALERAVVRLQTAGCELTSLSAMAKEASLELSKVCHTAEEESQRQVQCEYRMQFGNSRHLAPSDFLQQMIPLDRKRVLDLGCGTGHWSSRIADLYKWMRVVGVDCGAPFIAAAQERYTSDRLSFQVEDMAALSLPTGSVDCVYADNSLEHCFDVDRTLAEVHRVLSEGGVLVAALPSDARDSRRVCDNHTWKTAPHEVKDRLEAAGFVNVRVSEIDTYRRLGMPPYPPSLDRIMYVTAWKRLKPNSLVEHALEMMDWVYHAIEPSVLLLSSLNPCELIVHGRGSCLTYTVILGRFLQRQGYKVTWVTMIADGHPRGHGARQRDSHEVLAVEMDGREVILDPMANTYHPHSLRDLLCKPDLAVGKAMPDERYVARNFHLYDTAEWYGRVTKYQRRRDIAKSAYLTWWHRNPYKNRLRTVHRGTLPSLRSDGTDSRRS